eukprot:GILJ01020847.1.p1 GENE.GILJ01020847.1~~GILJ01020847.1.p1  ORF type:complete len:303 (+),score=23.25 GILJ01020847.1:200-1108(+)
MTTGQPVVDRLAEEFTAMTYRHGDTSAVLTPMMANLIRTAAPTEALPFILHNDQFRLCIFVTQLHDWTARLSTPLFKGFFGACAVAHFLMGNVPKGLFRRLCFYTGDEIPPFHLSDVQYCRLTECNIHDVLRATTCIPFICEKTTYISGVGQGMFVDGAVTDLIPDCTIEHEHTPGLLLHHSADVAHSFFDTIFRLQPPRNAFFENCSVLYPSTSFAQLLPGQRLPATSDWFDKEFVKNPLLRQTLWKETYKLSQSYWQKDILSLHTSSNERGDLEHSGGTGDSHWKKSSLTSKQMIGRRPF